MIGRDIAALLTCFGIASTTTTVTMLYQTGIKTRHAADLAFRGTEFSQPSPFSPSSRRSLPESTRLGFGKRTGVNR